MHVVLQNNTKMVKFFLTNQIKEKVEVEEPRIGIAVNMKDDSKYKNTALRLALLFQRDKTRPCDFLFSLKNDTIIELLNKYGGIASSIETDAKNIERAEVRKFELKKLILIIRQFVFL